MNAAAEKLFEDFWREIAPALKPLFSVEGLRLVARLTRIAFIAGNASGIEESIEISDRAIRRLTRTH